MCNLKYVLVFFGIWASLISCVVSSDILVVCPTASYSHQQPFLILTKALLQRNHAVTLITCNPEKMEKHDNLTLVDLAFTYEMWRRMSEFRLQGRIFPWKNIDHFSNAFSTSATAAQWSHPNMKTFLQMLVSTNRTYDLMILETWAHQSYYGLLDIIGDPPIISTATCHSLSPLTLPYGNPENPAYVPVVWTAHTDTMTFWQRFSNTFYYLYYVHKFFQTMDGEEKIRQTYVDKKYIKRSLREIFFNGTRNSYMSSWDSRITSYSRPVQPKIVEVGPLHLVQPKPLDKDLQTWIDGAEKGVIYFSLGSNMKSSSMGDFRRNAFLKAFARFPQYRVLWKWETENTMEGQSENVLLKKWMPQQDVLAHPKVQLFIMQGGLQSLQEAYHYGVKLICIPMFGDQDLNCQRVGKIKTGVVLEYTELNEQVIYEALKLVLENPVYTENMNYYSFLSKDIPMSPINKAMWWIEYVLRHKGVAHLHSSAADLSYIQYYLVDVIVFALSILLAVIGLLYLLARTILRKVRRVFVSETKKNKKKKIQ